MASKVAEKDGASVAAQKSSHRQYNESDADQALRAFEELGEKRLELDTVTSKRLLRRIDMFLMPVRFITHLLSSSDLTVLPDILSCIRLEFS